MTNSPTTRITNATQLPSSPKPPPVTQNGPIGSPCTTGEWLFTPLTASPNAGARLAFQPKLSPQLSQRALGRTYAVESTRLNKTDTAMLLWLDPGNCACTMA